MYVSKCARIYCLYQGVKYIHMCIVHIVCMFTTLNAYVCIVCMCMYVYIPIVYLHTDTNRYKQIQTIQTHRSNIRIHTIQTDTYTLSNTYIQCPAFFGASQIHEIAYRIGVQLWNRRGAAENTASWKKKSLPFFRGLQILDASVELKRQRLARYNLR